jgi:poly(hydroxyalkanoate) granule-associated protein
MESTMVKKVQKSTAAKKSASATASNGALSGAIRESAQQIWLAGLGAFSKAQEEGGKVFETLVKEGLTIQRKTQSVAEDRINEATSRVSHMASDISSKAAGQWDKLENLFEERVAKALGKLGVPSARDIESLLDRIDGLAKQVQSLGGQPVTARKPVKRAAGTTARVPVKAASKPAVKAAARKVPAKKAVKSA